MSHPPLHTPAASPCTIRQQRLSNPPQPRPVWTGVLAPSSDPAISPRTCLGQRTASFCRVQATLRGGPPAGKTRFPQETTTRTAPAQPARRLPAARQRKPSLRPQLRQPHPHLSTALPDQGGTEQSTAGTPSPHRLPLRPSVTPPPHPHPPRPTGTPTPASAASSPHAPRGPALPPQERPHRCGEGG